MSEKEKKVPELRFKGYHDDWEQRKLNDVLLQMKSGLSRKLSAADIGLPVIRANNIKNGKIDLINDIKYWYIHDPQGAKTSNYLVEKNDILVNFINSESKMGTTAIVLREPVRDTIYTTNIMKLKVNTKEYHSYFIFQQTLTSKYKNYIKIITKPAVNQASFTTVDFKKYNFYIPNYNEQKKISDLLKKLEDLITLHQRKINKMKEIKLLYLEKLFAIAEFLHPNIRFKSYTNEWISSQIKKYLIERNERSKIGDLVSVTIDSGVLKTESLNRKNNSSDDKSNYKVVKKGDIPYNSMRMWQGASGLSPFNGILSPAYTVLIPKETASGQFFSYQFKSRSMLYQFQKFSQGLTSDTWNLKYPLLKNIKISVPEFKEQKEIGDFLSKIDKNIELHQHRINQLKTIKKVYLDKIFI